MESVLDLISKGETYEASQLGASLFYRWSKSRREIQIYDNAEKILNALLEIKDVGTLKCYYDKIEGLVTIVGSINEKLLNFLKNITLITIKSGNQDAIYFTTEFMANILKLSIKLSSYEYGHPCINGFLANLLAAEGKIDELDVCTEYGNDQMPFAKTVKEEVKVADMISKLIYAGNLKGANVIINNTVCQKTELLQLCGHFAKIMEFDRPKNALSFINLKMGNRMYSSGDTTVRKIITNLRSSYNLYNPENEQLD